jgi:FkbM family methyltransferase
MNFSAISNQTLLGRLLRAPLALLPAGMRMPVLQGPLRGKTWLVGAHTHGCWLGSYEYEKQRWCSRLVAPGSVVYDVGANAGFYTLLGAVIAGPVGRVIAFEPLPRNLEYLRAHVRLNALGNVSVLDLAIADTPGTARFETRQTPAMGSLSEKGLLEVRQSSLDALVECAAIPPPDFIKMDIEGGELRALMGARRVLARYGPTLLLATHEDAIHRACVELLLELGYHCAALELGSLGHRSLRHGALGTAGELVATRRPLAGLESPRMSHT